MRSELKVAVLALGLISVSVQAFADDLDAASQEALKKTQALLTDPNARQKAVGEDAKAGWVDKQVKSLGGTQQNTDDIYGLTADIMATLTKESNGDPAKMMELLEQAKKDPTGFANKFSPEQKARLQGISQRIPAGTQPQTQPPPAPLK